MPVFHRFTSPISLLLQPILVILGFLFLWRLGLSLWQFERVGSLNQLLYILLQGVRFDLILLSMILLIPAVLTPLMATYLPLFRMWKHIFIVYMSAWAGVIVLVELSTPSFINEYDSRPNYLFVEYLEHFQEIFSTLIAAHPLQLLLLTIAVPLAVIFFYKALHKWWHLETPVHWVSGLLLVPLLLVVFLLLGRSSLDHRPANPSTVAVTPDHLVNDLALNSTYTVLYSVYVTKTTEAGSFKYGDMAFEQAMNIVRQEMYVDADTYTDQTIPTLHRQTATHTTAKPKNLVIVLEESLGAEFVGSLGGLPLTPNIDRLAGEGVWFKNLYATGTRSVRGIEAVVSGFLPTPARSVVKLNKSQQGFFTLAQLLKTRGYDNGFIYGGESHFDNMRGFFMGNGFNYVIDQNDYVAPIFAGSWGVSDEDLFNKAHEKFSSYGREQPFFGLVFSSSNHSPFEYPDGRIDLYDREDRQTVNNAVKYADYAVGQFIEQAKQSDYWENTIFLIVADHNSRVYGENLIPVERFHIPGLILGAGIKPEIIDTVASQIDLGPTLLSLMGISAEHPMIGRDLTREENRKRPGRAIMQFDRVQAYMEGDKLALLQKDKLPQTYSYNRKHGLVAQEIENGQALIAKALAHSLFAQHAYTQRLFRLP